MRNCLLLFIFTILSNVLLAQLNFGASHQLSVINSTDADLAMSIYGRYDFNKLFLEIETGFDNPGNLLVNRVALNYGVFLLNTDKQKAAIIFGGQFRWFSNDVWGVYRGIAGDAGIVFEQALINGAFITFNYRNYKELIEITDTNIRKNTFNTLGIGVKLYLNETVETIKSKTRKK